MASAFSVSWHPPFQVVNCPRTRGNFNASVATALALDMLSGLEALPSRHGQRVAFRIGVNSGPLVAGVIGRAKFQYDLWGDTVNVASRMESTGVAGRVQVSDDTYQLIKHAYDCESRGPTSIRGRGKMVTWLVVGPRS